MSRLCERPYWPGSRGIRPGPASSRRDAHDLMRAAGDGIGRQVQQGRGAPEGDEGQAGNLLLSSVTSLTKCPQGCAPSTGPTA